MNSINGNNLCIYHGNCADGFGAAWVVRNFYASIGMPIDFHAGVYSEPPPDVTDKNIVLVDFSYKRPMLLAMAAKARSILIIDHHKTAAADLINLPSNVETVFDMNYSGTMLTWMNFFPDTLAPKLIYHIEDRDLWRFNLPYTREIQAAVFSYPYDFNVWDQLMETPVDDLAQEGVAIERKHFKDIAELLPIVTRPMIIGGHKVQCANLPYIYSSDAGHELSLTNPFGACYWDTPTGRVFSLRSTDTGVDVSAVAVSYGGGGHRNASGFKVSYAEAVLMEVPTDVS